MARYDFSHPKDIFSGEFIKIDHFVMIMIDFSTQSHYIAPLRFYSDQIIHYFEFLFNKLRRASTKKYL